MPYLLNFLSTPLSLTLKATANLDTGTLRRGGVLTKTLAPRALKNPMQLKASDPWAGTEPALPQHR